MEKQYKHSTSKTLKVIVYYFCFSLLLYSCSKDGKMECEDVTIATVNMYSDSKKLSPPYNTEGTALFKDTLGGELRLTRLLGAGKSHSPRNHGIYCENGDDISFGYLDVEYDHYQLVSSQEIKLIFRTEVRALPEDYRENPLDTLLFDYASFLISHPNSNEDLRFKIWQEREITLPEEYTTSQDFNNNQMQKVSSITIGDNEFQDVLSFENEIGRLIFNGEFGLLMFEFFEIGRWEFDRFQ